MKLRDLPTPCYVIDEERLTENLRILEGVEVSGRVREAIQHP